jgi:hypothetical protein
MVVMWTLGMIPEDRDGWHVGGLMAALQVRKE